MGTVTEIPRANFAIGELVHHRLFDYRGVVVDVDPKFQGIEEWYQTVRERSGGPPPRPDPRGRDVFIARKPYEPE